MFIIILFVHLPTSAAVIKPEVLFQADYVHDDVHDISHQAAVEDLENVAQTSKSVPVSANRFLSKTATVHERLADGSKPGENNSTCVLTLCRKCVSTFRHVTFYQQAAFVHLHLVADNETSLKADKGVVSAKSWVWTYYGKDGGFPFLKWPTEAGVWSMGLLSSYTVTVPIKIQLLRKSGNCSNLTVGKKDSDTIISRALLELSLEMMAFNQEYNITYAPSFFCYRKRVFIESRTVYNLCKFFFCPLDALAYSCCSNSFRLSVMRREIVCKEQVFKYESLWWVLPCVLSLIIFGFSPLIIMYVINWFSECVHGNEGTRELVVLDGKDHVTFLGTVMAPLTCLINYLKYSNPTLYSQVLIRIHRCLYPLLSVSVIMLQIFLDYKYFRWYIYRAVQSGVPLGFRTMIVGYASSKDKFLPHLGGPFVALGVYLLVTCLLIVIPDSLSHFLISGLTTRYTEETQTPLKLGIRSVEIFGRVPIRTAQGYDKLYKLFLGHSCMIVNIRFWKYTFSVQKRRVISWTYGRTNVFCLMLPFYIATCVLEVLLCILLYGFPIFSFGMTLVKAYLRHVGHDVGLGFFARIRRVSLGTIFIGCILYFLFMFSTIVLDAILLVIRILIFTFSGILMYPKISYGFMIFAFTVIYYVWDCVQDFAKGYQRLLNEIVHIGKSMEAGEECLVVEIGDFKAVPRPLFEYIIEMHLPRRHEVVKSLVRMTIILLVLELSLSLLTEIDGFRELHVIMHVGTALFICAMPQILKSVCKGKRGRIRRKLFRKKVAESMRRYAGYIDERLQINDELSD